MVSVIVPRMVVARIMLSGRIRLGSRRIGVGASEFRGTTPGNDQKQPESEYRSKQDFRRHELARRRTVHRKASMRDTAFAVQIFT